MIDGPARGPRNIVLLSDGTGNSGAKLFKTNVWRIYEGLDLSHGDVAFYDNGVGTSSFKPLALVGGAFGWGLKRNVRDIYAFLCRNYRHGDRIFAFGFSRGAFTIRVLLGLIDRQGILTGVDGVELSRLVAWAFRQYRRRYHVTGGLVTPIRNVRDAMLRAWEALRGRTPYSKASRLEGEPIAFVGLWDTVDAYGLPVDELTRGWDQWIWPVSMRDRRLSCLVRKACHVLALDDERNTFHPLLWTERGQSTGTHIDDERITQVWFSGVHSNVGGGYPDDALALVSLLWMVEQAQKHGLHLHKSAVEAWHARASVNGPIYDSRRGLGGYYRYRPRSIAALSQDPRHEVSIAQPKIHESVFQRLIANTDSYAPIVLPEKYGVVDAAGAILDGSRNPYESPSQSESRVSAQEAVWNVVWWRRVVYFATVWVSATLALLPFLPVGDVRRSLDTPVPVLSGLIGLFGSILPSVANRWIVWYQVYPLKLVVGVTLLSILLACGSSLSRAIRDKMRALWNPIVASGAQPVLVSPAPRTWLCRVRTNRLYTGFFRLLTWQVVPFVFGVGALVLLVALGAASAIRVSFDAASVAGYVCSDGSRVQARRLATGQSAVEKLDPAALCGPTSVLIERHGQYRVTVALPSGSGGWRDGEYEATTPKGIAMAPRPLVFTVATPIRRSLSWNWLVPMARIGSTGAEYYGLPDVVTEFTAWTDGRLFLYVNDAVLPWPWWDRFYRNNSGSPATVTVERLR